MNRDQIVDSFAPILKAAEFRCPIITVYKHPADRPTKYVARLFDLQESTPFIAVGDTLEEVRRAIPRRFIRFNPDYRDPSHIIETYV